MARPGDRIGVRSHHHGRAIIRAGDTSQYVGGAVDSRFQPGGAQAPNQPLPRLHVGVGKGHPVGAQVFLTPKPGDLYWKGFGDPGAGARMYRRAAELGATGPDLQILQTRLKALDALEPPVTPPAVVR
jgi:hypothetical protein